MSKLTPNQEKFITEILYNGQSQRKAYRIAYPNSRKWKDGTVDSRASRLMKESKVFTRFNELKAKMHQKAKENRLYERNDLTRGLLWLITESRNDIQKNGVRQATATAIINAIKELNAMDSNYISQQIRDEKVRTETQVVRETGHMMKDAVLPVFINDIPLGDEDED